MVDSSEDEVWLTDFSTNLAHWQVRKHKVLDFLASSFNNSTYLLASSEGALQTCASV